jgi:hypothetical protein
VEQGAVHAGVVKNALNAPPNNELHWSPLESHTLPETSHERPTSPRQYPLPLALETQTSPSSQSGSGP